MNPLLVELIKNPRDLPLALQTLRQAAETVPCEPLLLEWGRRKLKLNPESERQWYQRAWWGLFAGELIRAKLHHPKYRVQVFDLMDEPDWSEFAAVRAEGRGIILAGAHLGPPKTAMNYLMSQRLPLIIWTDMNSFPEWWKNGFEVTYVDPARNPASLAKTAFHLRNNGVLFGAPDTPSGRNTVKLDGFAPWHFSLGLPTLAKKLALPVFRFTALWHENRIRISYERVATPPDRLTDDAWNRQWLDYFSGPLDRIAQASPENLRFLLFVDNRAISKQLDLW